MPETTKNLPLEVHKRGVFYKQVKRTLKKALYSLSYVAQGPIIGFDVFRVRERPEAHLWGKTFERCEAFPCNTDYGKTAWSFTHFEAASKKFEVL